VTGGAEGYALGGDGGVGVERVVRGNETRNIDEGSGAWQLAGLVGGDGRLCVCRVHAFGILAGEYFHHCTIWDARLLDRMTRKWQWKVLVFLGVFA
jgi:hypothetical protein